jgi:hypothetical protein
VADHQTPILAAKPAAPRPVLRWQVIRIVDYAADVRVAGVAETVEVGVPDGLVMLDWAAAPRGPRGTRRTGWIRSGG